MHWHLEVCICSITVAWVNGVSNAPASQGWLSCIFHSVVLEVGCLVAGGADDKCGCCQEQMRCVLHCWCLSKVSCQRLKRRPAMQTGGALLCYVVHVVCYSCRFWSGLVPPHSSWVFWFRIFETELLKRQFRMNFCAEKTSYKKSACEMDVDI